MFACTKSELDLFLAKPVQTAILGIRDILYKSIASVNQTNLEFVIPGDNETHIDLNIKLYVHGKLTMMGGGEELDATDHSSVIKNFLGGVQPPICSFFEDIIKTKVYSTCYSLI